MKPPTEGELFVQLTAPTLPGRIAEAREQLDSWLATLTPPPAGMVQVLTLVSYQPTFMTYQLTLREMATRGEARMIL